VNEFRKHILDMTRREIVEKTLSYYDLMRLCSPNGRIENVHFVRCTFEIARGRFNADFRPSGCTFDAGEEKAKKGEWLASRRCEFAGKAKAEKELPPANVIVRNHIPRATGRTKKEKIIPVPPAPKDFSKAPIEKALIESWERDAEAPAWGLIQKVAALSRQAGSAAWDHLHGHEAHPELAMRVKKFLKVTKMTEKDLEPFAKPEDFYAVCAALLRVGHGIDFQKFSAEAIAKKAKRTEHKAWLEGERKTAQDWKKYKIGPKAPSAKQLLEGKEKGEKGRVQRMLDAKKKAIEDAKKKLPKCHFCGKHVTESIEVPVGTHGSDTRRVCLPCRKCTGFKFDQAMRIAWRRIEAGRPVPDSLKQLIAALDKELNLPEKRFSKPLDEAIRETDAKREAEVETRAREEVKRKASDVKTLAAFWVKNPSRAPMELIEIPLPHTHEDKDYALMTRTQCGLCNGALERPTLAPAIRKGVQILPLCGRCSASMVRWGRENWIRNF